MTKTVYKAKWILDVAHEAVIRDGGVLVVDGRIADVGHNLMVDDGTRTVDLGEATLLPGMVDCHVHLPFDGSVDPVASFMKLSVPEATVMAVKNGQHLLRMGITTIRDVSTPYGISLGVRNCVEQGAVAGPRILAAGTHICITGGHGASFGIEADGPYEVRKAVRSQLKAGADFVKIMLTGGVYSLRQQPDSIQLRDDELRAAVELAHEAGVRVACHAEGELGIQIALEAGVDTIEHGNELNAALAAQMAAQETYLVPTAVSFKAVATSPVIVEPYRSKARRMFEATQQCLRLAREAGVKVAAGTDSGTGMYLPWDGFSMVQELELYVGAGGFSVLEAVKAATLVAARAAGVADVVGSLEVGKAADLVAVPGDLTAGLDALRRPLLVLREGEVVHRASVN